MSTRNLHGSHTRSQRPQASTDAVHAGMVQSVGRVFGTLGALSFPYV